MSMNRRLNRRLNGRLLRALVVGVSIAVPLGLLHVWDMGMALWLAAATAVGAITLVVPSIGMRWLGDINRGLRAMHWRREQGQHHSFNGVALRVIDQGRSMWVDGAGVQRVLGMHDSDELLCARHSGNWIRDDRGEVLLQVEALAQHLAHMPGRNDPAVQRFRRYLEREVLFPAAERRRRA